MSSVLAQLAPYRTDTAEFIGRLWLESEKGPAIQFDDPYDEQIIALDDFTAPDVRLAVHLKPRQVGDSTVACAVNFDYLYWTPDPVKTLVIADSDETNEVLFRKYRFFYDNLPKAMRRPLHRGSAKEISFKDTKATVRVVTAGGRSKGRGWTYQRMQAEELAYWPNAEEVWGSVTATLHQGPHFAQWIISTANGPDNLYHKKVLLAMEARDRGDPTVRFSFFRWCDHRGYRLAVPKNWDPNQEEFDIKEQYGLDWEQIYWRHNKIWGVDGIGPDWFRKHYPMTEQEGFIVLDGNFFDAHLLNQYLSAIPITEDAVRNEHHQLRIFEHPSASQSYVIGVDPSWCNGGDYAVAQILSHDGVQVATFSMNNSSDSLSGEWLFAEHVAELAAYYNDARVLVEGNPGGAGINVIRILQKEGVKLWWHRDRGAKRAKYWTTTAGKREEALGHARKMINSDTIKLNDRTTINELLHFREENGKIQGQDGYHDDHAMALALALWNMRTMPKPSVKTQWWKKKHKASRSAMGALRRAMVR